jgi:SAM-dependent methyltransferase
MALAETYCVGHGLEIGAGAHNWFSVNSRNVAPGVLFPEEHVFYQDAQQSLCGTYALVDIEAYADHIPVRDQTEEFILASHVLEHVPDILGTFSEWDRILTVGGIVFLIVPKHDAHPPDRGRPISTLDQMIVAAAQQISANEAKHLWVFDIPLLLTAVAYTNQHQLTSAWSLIAYEETDSKVGNGHTLVFRKTLARNPDPVILAEEHTLTRRSVKRHM